MQNFPRIGEIVDARRRRWRVSDVRDYPGCALVTLEARDRAAPATGMPSDSSRPHTAHLLVPFDELQPARDAIRPVRVTRSQWLGRLTRLSTTVGEVDSLHTALAANLELFAYQLEPATALLRGRARRLLIADEVGLGKTVQAGLAAAELLARGLVDRVLILAPAGLREQWVSELRFRFSLEFALLDMRGVQSRRARLPAHVNPWTTETRVVTSIDYVKRPETLPAVLECRWDLVIVDEAHGSVTGDRQAAVRELCETAGAVILLTATPHSGDRTAFEHLCAIGNAGDPLLLFRRTRGDVGLPRQRRVHVLNVRSTWAERRLQAVLERFADAVRRDQEHAGDATLALAVLRKRAMSSASSLARTVRRRLDQLDTPAAPPDQQMMLDFGDQAGEHDADQDPAWTCPPLHDVNRERRLLTAIVEAAAVAAIEESKVRVVRRLLTRLQEPVLVFTEYRDTLLHLRKTAAPDAAVLHGGLSRAERAAAVEAFTQGDARVLLATDAAGEGLNLHHRCRIVLNVELPWNPVRLEQRTGRVDRIGQQRRVHTFHLVAHEAGERAVAGRLDTKRADAQADLDAWTGQRIDVSREFERLRSSRRQLAAMATSNERLRPGASRPSDNHTEMVAVCRHPGWRWRAALGPAAMAVFRFALIDSAGRAVATRIVPVAVVLGGGVRLRSRAEIRRFVATLRSFDLAQHDPALNEWVSANVTLANAFRDGWRARELAIIERAHGGLGSYRQQSLFTQRAATDSDAARRSRATAAAQFRLTALHHPAVGVAAAPALIVLP
jgi:superfamily II DNA or RNA helicase